MNIDLIIAATDNDVISDNAGENWILPADLKHFREKTIGHSIIMGRKTYEKIGKPLPERKNIVLTTHKDWKAEGAETATTPEEALQIAGDGVFVIGGAEMWKIFEDQADTAYLTRVHINSQGTIKFALKPEDWEETEIEQHEADAENKHAYTFLTYKKR